MEFAERKKPVRLQVRREKGYRLPEGIVFVGRTSRWGNPHRPGFPHRRTGQVLNAAGAVEAFRHSLLHGRLPITCDDVRLHLRGRDLACWCALHAPCHADVLLEMATEYRQDLICRKY